MTKSSKCHDPAITNWISRARTHHVTHMNDQLMIFQCCTSVGAVRGAVRGAVSGNGFLFLFLPLKITNWISHARMHHVTHMNESTAPTEIQHRMSQPLPPRYNIEISRTQRIVQVLTESFQCHGPNITKPKITNWICRTALRCMI